MLHHIVIKQVIENDVYSKFDFVIHYPLRLIVKDYSKLDEHEIKYLKNKLTHLDFLIYNKFNKKPILAIEVDGVSFHRVGTKQSQRDKIKDNILEKYGLALLRLPTNGSDEKRKIEIKLKEVY